MSGTLTWDEVVEKPEYQSMSKSEKKAARYEYFNEVIKPQLQPHEIAQNWEAFKVDSELMQKSTKIK